MWVLALIAGAAAVGVDTVSCFLAEDGSCTCGKRKEEDGGPRTSSSGEKEDKKKERVLDPCSLFPPQKLCGDTPRDKVTVITSSDAGERWNVTVIDREVVKQDDKTDSDYDDVVGIFSEPPSPTKILGFGGAFTDAATYVINSLPEDMQDIILEGYFVGLNYTFGRTHMGSCDFSRTNYTLLPNRDFEMAHFVLRDDREWKEGDQSSEHPDAKLELMLRAQAIAAQNTSAHPHALNFFFAPWSPPSWMKDNNDYRQGRILQNSDILEAYASLFLKFITEYKKRGIHFWAVMPQNEPDTWQPPLLYTQFESCRWTPMKLREFVVKYLGPRLRDEHPEIKIFHHDGQMADLESSADEYMRGESAHYTDGFSYHWYTTLFGSFENTWSLFHLLGGGAQVLDVKQKYGDEKMLLSTEACTGAWFPPLFWQKSGPSLGDWSRAYRYARDITYQLLNGAQGWVDWNLALDTTGGPNHAGNMVDAPIIVDTNETQFHANPMYYAIGHYSAYIPPGSQLVEIAQGHYVETAAFIREDDHVVIVVLNDQHHMNSNIRLPNFMIKDRKVRFRVTFRNGDIYVFKHTIKRHSINTIIVPPPANIGDFPRKSSASSQEAKATMSEEKKKMTTSPPFLMVEGEEIIPKITVY